MCTQRSPRAGRNFGPRERSPWLRNWLGRLGSDALIEIGWTLFLSSLLFCWLFPRARCRGRGSNARGLRALVCAAIDWCAARVAGLTAGPAYFASEAIARRLVLSSLSSTNKTDGIRFRRNAGGLELGLPSALSLFVLCRHKRKPKFVLLNVFPSGFDTICLCICTPQLVYAPARFFA